MKRIRTVIVDDEKKAREGLKSLLSQDPNIELIKTCKDGVEAIEYLKSEDCDLLLLDIQMPAVSGFEVLKSIKKPPFTIFITAYDEYALKAFEFHALDYLLKPFSDQRFFDAIDRAKKLIRNNHSALSAKMDELLKQLESTEEQSGLVHSSDNDIQRLVIKVSGKILLLDTKDILWIEGQDYCVKIHMEGNSHLINGSLKGIIQKLPSNTFLRVHKSAIINTQQIASLEHLQNAEYMVTLSNKAQVKVSRSYKQQMDEFLNGL
ncbi:LytTR family DNA-binding domain-containing protein [Roseivirga sp. E12]|uniref:LytR/AlgR family response regulator transcription factor n=1 Tax=Roseivirga sp. E12 TaxID=2819237 RepID=UPI001ABC2328|nr:LytTR family DNA-binding domain-containing protein [Roseivirga sp. E12]MBO3697024.1 response regulator transcription factor [Roseivirga sp. E12]